MVYSRRPQSLASMDPGNKVEGTWRLVRAPVSAPASAPVSAPCPLLCPKPLTHLSRPSPSKQAGIRHRKLKLGLYTEPKVKVGSNVLPSSDLCVPSQDLEEECSGWRYVNVAVAHISQPVLINVGMWQNARGKARQAAALPQPRPQSAGAPLLCRRRNPQQALPPHALTLLRALTRRVRRMR